MTFGDFIKEKRQLKDLNLRKLADIVDIAPAYLSDIEKGKRNSPSEDKMDAIAKALELSAEEIIIMHDLAAADRGNVVAPDITEYVMKNDQVRVALRKAKDLKLGDKEWMKIIEAMENGEAKK